jgi:hypothetical protein
MGKISSQTLRRLTNRLSLRESVAEPAQASSIEIAGSRGRGSWAC